MYIVYGHAELFLPSSSSLKEKRKTIQSMIARIRKRFNISICEADYQDLWQRSVLGFSAVCSHAAETDMMLDAIQQTLERHEDVCEVTAFTHFLFQVQSIEKNGLIPTNDGW